MEKSIAAGHQHAQSENNMNRLHPGRSAMPPAFALATGADQPPSSLLQASIGRNGENKPEDLLRFGKFLLGIGLPPSAVTDVLNPSQNGALIEKYQRQVLGFRNPDGRIDPGGKTETAMRDLQGRDVVMGWYVKKAPEKIVDDEALTSKAPKTITKTKAQIAIPELAKGEQWLIPPLMSEADYITQAPAIEAGGPKTLTKDQLFSHALESYGPFGKRNIEVEANWPKHSRWKHRKYGGWTDYKGAMRATHWIACHNACIYMAQNAGVGGVSQNPDYNQKMKDSDVKGKTAEALIDAQLAQGLVVVVRVDDHHSIVIMGKGQDEKGKYYVFFDPGRTGTKGYNLNKNRLYINEKSIGNDRYHSVTSVRQSKPQP